MNKPFLTCFVALGTAFLTGCEKPKTSNKKVFATEAERVYYENWQVQHIVEKGDTLWSLASRYETKDENNWVLPMNKKFIHTVSTDPRFMGNINPKLTPGQLISFPAVIRLTDGNYAHYCIPHNKTNSQFVNTMENPYFQAPEKTVSKPLLASHHPNPKPAVKTKRISK